MIKFVAAVILILFSFHEPFLCQAEEHIPFKAQIVLVKASQLMEKKQYAQAASLLNTFRRHTQEDKTAASIYEHPEINLALGNCLSLQGNFKEAAAAYNRVLKQDADNPFAWQNLGRCRYEQKQYEEASHCFLKAYELKPQQAELLYQSAATMLMAEKTTQAITLFERLLHNHPGKILPEWKENLVSAYLTVKQNRKALPYIRELAEQTTGKKQRQWKEILLQQYMLLNRYKDALALVQSLTRLEPNEPLWWKLEAHILLQQNQLKQALRALTIYRYLKPLTAEEKELIADLQLQLGIPGGAAKDYEDYLKEKPSSQILRRLVSAYMEMGALETALKKLTQNTYSGKQGDLVLLQGDILYRLKRYKEAAAVFTQATSSHQKASGTGRAYFMLAHCRWRMDELNKSLVAFKKAAGYKQYTQEATLAIRQIEQYKSIMVKEKG